MRRRRETALDQGQPRRKVILVAKRVRGVWQVRMHFWRAVMDLMMSRQ